MSESMENVFHKVNNSIKPTIRKDILNYLKTTDILLYKINIEELDININKINIVNQNELELEVPILYRDSYNNICKLQSYNIHQFINYVNTKNIDKICLPIISNTMTDKFRNEHLYWNILIFKRKTKNKFNTYWFNFNGNKYKKTESELITSENLLFNLISYIDNNETKLENIVINPFNYINCKYDNKELQLCIKIANKF